MVTIKKEDGKFVFEVRGMHKLWAFKNQLIIPQEHIINAYQDAKLIDGPHGIRIPGTYIPGIITAGTYIQNGNMIFWDVSKKENAIVIDLEDEQYKKLVVEVENPLESIAFLKSEI